MKDAEVSHAIARLLAHAWTFHQTPEFLEYAMNTFGCTLAEVIQCDRIYIAEAEDGDAAKGVIGGAVKQWWFVDSQGLVPIPFARLPMFRDQPENIRSGFYITPVIKFLRQGEAIAIGEAFGPDMHCRKVGRIELHGDSLQLSEVRLVWSSNAV